MTHFIYFNRLLHCGLDNIEVGSFVSSKWVPQMSNTDEVYKGLSHIPKNSTILSVLTPNIRGFRDAMNVNVKEIAIFAACSEEFTKKNINCTIIESLNRYRIVCEAANQNGVKVRGYISCVLGCPYEGNVSNELTLSIIQEFFSMGCYEVSLGDTIGAGTPESTFQLLSLLSRNHIPMDKISMHFHDTHNRALSNILVALTFGITHIDASISGLGGCPYAGCGSGGNVATEDVVWLLHSMGIQTHVDMKSLLKARQFIDTLLNRESRAKIPLEDLKKMITNKSDDDENDENDDDDFEKEGEEVGGGEDDSGSEYDIESRVLIDSA